MLLDSETRQTQAPAYSSLQHLTGKVRSDLLVLQYMARRVRTHARDKAAHALPSIDYVNEHRSRPHRIVIYKQQEILFKRNLAFVGFISKIQEHVSSQTIQEIHKVEDLLIPELTNHAGLLSYSSLELRKGRWYNLVIFSDSTDRTYFEHHSTHRYAAQLATHYYAWIRLHNGSMPCGLLPDKMTLLSTKYYAFPEIGRPPIRQEVLYDNTIHDSPPPPRHTIAACANRPDGW